MQETKSPQNVYLGATQYQSMVSMTATGHNHKLSTYVWK